VNSSEEMWRRARCREEEEEENRRGEGVWVGFVAAHYFVEERERRSGHRIGLKTAGGAGVPSGAWQPLRSGSPTWQGEGRTAEAARAVGGGVGRRVEGRCRAAVAREAAGGGGSRARAEAEELGDSRKTMEDLSAISEKSRDPTVKYR
jgi:hypothetical protein